MSVPEWAEEEYYHLVGRRVMGVVVDRMPTGYEGDLDLWPGLFARLAGPDWRRLGTVGVRYEECYGEF